MPRASPARTARLTPCTARTDAVCEAECLCQPFGFDDRDAASAHAAQVVGLCRWQPQRGGVVAAPAGGQVVRCDRQSGGSARPATRLREGAAVGKAATRRRIEQRGRRALDRHQRHRVAAHVGEGVGQAHRVGMVRRLQHRGERARFHHLAGIHHRAARSQV